MTHTVKVLLIEDNPGDARLIQELLRGNGFRLTIVDSLKGGLHALRADPYDITLLDLSLPDSQGVETVKKVREQVPDVPIVVLTGQDDQIYGVQSLQAGAQDYLVKDETQTHTTLLERAVRYAIERHRAEEVIRRSQEEYRSLIKDVFNNSSTGVIITDRNLRVAWVNEAVETYLGITREEMMGKEKPDLIENHIKHVFDNPDHFARKMMAAFENKQFIQRFECHVLPDDHREERWLEYSSQPIRSGMYAGGRIGQYTDITRRKQVETAEREQRLLAEALCDIMTLLTSSLDLEEVLDHILENISRVVPHDAANILLLEEGELYVARWLGYGDRPLQSLGQWRFSILSNPALAQMIHKHEPVVMGDIQAEIEWRTLIEQEWLCAYAGIPIVLQEEIIGFINLFSKTTDFFTPDHIERLEAFGAQAAIAIQNARIYEQSQALATLEERQRLARELHDSVTQTLFTSSVIAESALRQWDINPTKAQDLLQQLHHLTNSALAEMRVLLLELRPASLTKVHLRELIGQLVQSLQSRKHIKISTQVGNLPPLPPDLQITLFRIIQEALNNIVKHADASHVWITIEEAGSRLQLTVEDDGKGFDRTQIAPLGLGVGIMRERAHAAGAVLDIYSTPGEGTRLVMTWTPNQG